MKAKSIGLVIPPSPFLLDERVFMPLGILKVAASLRQAGWGVEMLDLSGIENYLDVAEAFFKSTSSQIIGFTSTTPQFPACFQIAELSRRLRPELKLILGGPHATLTLASVKQELKLKQSRRAQDSFQLLRKTFDVVVTGDGELSVLQAVDVSSSGVVDADQATSDLFLNDASFSRLPIPARELLDIESYHFNMDGLPGLSLIAQLGCPFACGFCSGRTSPSFRRIRLRSSDSVIDEITLLYHRYNVRAFMFYDDELNVNPDVNTLLGKLIQMQSDLGVEFVFRGCVKAELFTESQGRLFHEAGFRTILVGFESGSPKILQNINKKATVDDNTRCVGIAKANDIRVKALMSIGHPGEDQDTIEDTYKWLLHVAPDEFDVSIITVLPGTPYYDLAVPKPGLEGTWQYRCRTGDNLYFEEVDFSRVMSYYKGNPLETYRSFVFTDGLTSEQVVEARELVDRGVRSALKLSRPLSVHSILYEHSMGQLGPLVLKKLSD